MKVIVPATQDSFDVRLEKGAAIITLSAAFDAENPHNTRSLTDLVSMLKAGTVMVEGLEKMALIATPGGQAQQQVQTAPPTEGAPQFATADQVAQLQQQIQQLEQVIMQLTGGSSQQGQSGGAAPVPPAAQAATPPTGAQQGQPAAGSPPLPPPASAQTPQPAAKAAKRRWGGLVD